MKKEGRGFCERGNKTIGALTLKLKLSLRSDAGYDGLLARALDRVISDIVLTEWRLQINFLVMMEQCGCGVTTIGQWLNGPVVIIRAKKSHCMIVQCVFWLPTRSAFGKLSLNCHKIWPASVLVLGQFCRQTNMLRFFSPLVTLWPWRSLPSLSMKSPF